MLHYKIILNVIKDSMVLFKKKSGTTLASSSSFYILLTIVPFFLLIIRFIGMFLGDVEGTQAQLFDLAAKFLPDVAPDILTKIQGIVRGPLFAKGQFTLINTIILIFSSLSFFNSIWNGLYLITEDKRYLNNTKYFKGIIVIGFTILVLTILFFLPTLVFYIGKLMSNNIIVEFIELNFPDLFRRLSAFSSSNFQLGFVVKSNFFHFLVFTTYFTFLYRWFFSWKLSKRQSLVGSLTFSSLIILGKNLFWVYFMYVRESLMRNYGDYYTLIIAILWIYLAMSFFYFGVCVCTTLMKKKLLVKTSKA